jgi:hypothetical protein
MFPSTRQGDFGAAAEAAGAKRRKGEEEWLWVSLQEKWL